MEKSFSPQAGERLTQAWSLFQKGDKRQAIEHCEILVRDGYEPAHLLSGLIYEFGGDGIEVNLPKAVEHYRRIAFEILSPVGYIHLARALMKQGGERHNDALRYIEEAESIERVPEVDLAYAKYYEGGSDPDYVRARHYYLRAALAGRFAGFFGYAAISRKMGQYVRAALADCLRIVAGPFLFLLLGKQASKNL